MAWLTNKDTGGHFNTDWLEEEKTKNKQIAENKKQADAKNKGESNPFYEQANEMYHAKYRYRDRGDLTFERAIAEYSNEDYEYNDYISEELKRRGGTPRADLYRGMSFRNDPTSRSWPFYEQQLKDKEVGDTIVSNQLSSFDTAESKAKEFATTYQIQVMLHLINNTKARDISNLSTARLEQEYLAPKNVEYVVVKKYKKGNILYYDVKEK